MSVAEQLRSDNEEMKRYIAALEAAALEMSGQHLATKEEREVEGVKMFTVSFEEAVSRADISLFQALVRDRDAIADCGTCESVMSPLGLPELSGFVRPTNWLTSRAY